MADDNRINHRKVYSRGFYDGIAAAGGELKADKVEEKLRGRSSQEQKSYAAVPIQDWWSAAQIGTAVQRASGSVMDRKTLDGCLMRLKDAGLISMRADGTFKRVEVREKVIEQPMQSTEVILTKGTDIPLAAAPQGTKPFDRMLALAENMRCHADYLTNMAKQVEEMALEMEEKRESDDAEVQELRQLKTLLKKQLA